MAGRSHIILLPQNDYFQWVKATQLYVLTFGVNMTPDPVKAGSKEIVTVAVAPNGYPGQGDIEAWMKARFPNTTLDPIPVNTPEDLTAVLTARVGAAQPFGDGLNIPKTDTSGSTEPSDTKPDDRIPPGDNNNGIQLHWPSDYPSINQGFGDHPEIYEKWGLPGHEGLDIRAPMNTNVYAAAEGVVFAAEKDPNKHPYGKHIRIRHADGYRTVYAHLAQVLVNVGDRVAAKKLIGKADSTGNSSGSHVHLTLKKDGATARGETIFQGDVIDPTPHMIDLKK